MLEMEKIKMVLASNMKKLREINKMSQLLLAERSNLSIQMIRDVEAGRRWPSAASIEAIAKGLGVAVSVLFSEEVTSLPAEPDIESSLKSLMESFGYEISKKS